MISMEIPRFKIDDVVIMKKKHACSSDRFRIARIGSDIRIICIGCSRDITLERTKLEKMIRKIENQ